MSRSLGFRPSLLASSWKARRAACQLFLALWSSGQSITDGASRHAARSPWWGSPGGGAKAMPSAALPSALRGRSGLR